MSLAPMTDIEHHGSFSGQQHNGQQNNQQNPQQGQADPMLDTRMSLDQGKDGRLLRLNINDANWTDRLLRNIQSNPVKGSDETIQVILEPAKLGRLVVQISITGNNTNVQITSATAEAAAILADAEPRLQQVFEQHGLKLGQMQTSMGQGFSNQWSQGQGSSSSERNNKTGTKNATQDEEQSTKILENDKTGQVNILA
jgi:flagellar hook-length control protein FliK